MRRADRCVARTASNRLVVGIHPEPEDVELPLPQPEVARDQRVDLDGRDERDTRRHGHGGDQVAVRRRACRGRSGQASGRRRRRRRAPGPRARGRHPTGSSARAGRRSRVRAGRRHPRGQRDRGGASGAAWRGRTSAPRRPARAPRAAGCARWPRARPVAGSMSIWVALKTTGPIAHLEPRRQRVDEARQHGRGIEPDDAPHRARHPEVGLVGRAARAGSARHRSRRGCGSRPRR